MSLWLQQALLQHLKLSAYYSVTHFIARYTVSTMNYSAATLELKKRYEFKKSEEYRTASSSWKCQGLINFFFFICCDIKFIS